MHMYTHNKLIIIRQFSIFSREKKREREEESNTRVCMKNEYVKPHRNLTEHLRIFTFFRAAYEISIGEISRRVPTTEKCGSDTSSIIIDSIIDHRGTQEKLKEAISEDIRSISPGGPRVYHCIVYVNGKHGKCC